MHISDFLVYIIWLHTKNVLSYNSDGGYFYFGGKTNWINL